MGLYNIAKTLSAEYATNPNQPPGFLDIMAQSDEGAQKARQYSDLLGQLMNVVKGFAQRLAEKAKAGNGSEANGELAKVQSQIQKDKMVGDAKIQATQEKAAQTQAQKQAGFELAEQRKDRETEAQIRRTDAIAAVETAADIRRKGAESIASEESKSE